MVCRGKEPADANSPADQREAPESVGATVCYHTYKYQIIRTRLSASTPKGQGGLSLGLARDFQPGVALENLSSDSRAHVNAKGKARRRGIRKR